MNEVPTTPPAVNPLTQNLKMPGETVRLPSGGLFYQNGELDDGVTDGELHVYPMTAIDEIVMKSPDKLFSGDAIREIFRRCVPQIKDVDLIFAKDVDFLLIALRKVSYGPEIEVKYNHECGSTERPSENHSYMVDVNMYLNNAKVIDPTTVKTKYSMTIEDTGQVVSFRPMRFKDVVKAMQANDSDLTPEQQQVEMFDMLLAVIHNVDGIEDPALIIDWLSKIRAANIQKLFDHIQNVSDWGANQMFSTTCKDCGEMIEIHAQVNTLNFFT